MDKKPFKKENSQFTWRAIGAEKGPKIMPLS